MPQERLVHSPFQLDFWSVPHHDHQHVALEPVQRLPGLHCQMSGAIELPLDYSIVLQVFVILEVFFLLFFDRVQ